jgi:hypothetical protein
MVVEGTGARSRDAPGFLKRFFESTLIMGRPRRWKRLTKISDYSSRNSITLTMSAFFSNNLRPPRTAGAARRYILSERLLASAGDSARVQAEDFGQNGIASVSQLDRFRPREQTALLLVEPLYNRMAAFSSSEIPGERGIAQQRKQLDGLLGA